MIVQAEGEAFLINPFSTLALLQLITTYYSFWMKIINEQLLMSYIENNHITAKFETYAKEIKLGTCPSLQVMTLQEIKNTCQKINPKETSQQNLKEFKEGSSALSWKKGELKLFIWVLVYYSFNIKKQILELHQSEYHFLQQIFLQRNYLRLKYEVSCLFFPKSGHKTPWNSQQVDIFHSIISNNQNNNKRIEWKSIAYDLFTLSQGKFFRTNSQCRERWLNHLNPQVTKGDWSREEDYFLMETVQQYGTKWSQIAKQFQGTRTEHMVKNRYISLIHKWKNGRNGKTNKQIQHKIMSTIRRNIERKTKKKVGNGNSTFEGKNQEQKLLVEHIDSVQKIQEENNLQQDNFTQKNPLSCNVVQQPRQLIKTQQKLEQLKPSIHFIQDCLCEKIQTPYREESLKEIIDDLVEKLGCGQGAFIDMIFRTEEQWVIEPEES